MAARPGADIAGSPAVLRVTHLRTILLRDARDLDIGRSDQVPF